MKVTTERTPDCTAIVTVEADAEQVQHALKSAAQKVSRIRPIPGFRPGKAPYELIERAVGRELLLDEALDELAQTLYKQVLIDENIEPYDAGKLEIISKEPVTLKFTVPTRPTVPLGDYHSIHLKPKSVEVTDAEVDALIEQVRREQAEMTPVTRPAQMGDLVTLNIQGGFPDREPLNREGLPVNLEKENGVFPWLEQLVGVNAGETRTITHTTTGENPQTATYMVTVIDVKEPRLPALDDDFAKSVSAFETFDLLRKKVRADLYERKESEENERLTDEAVDAVVQQAQIAYPATMIEDETDQELERSKGVAQRLGLTWEKYLQLSGKNEADFRTELRPRAEQRVRRLLTLMELGNTEKIQVSRKDIDVEIDQRAMYAQRNGGNAAQTRRQLSSTESRRDIEFQLKLRKTIDRVVAIVKGEPTSGLIVTPEMVREEERRAREQAAAQAAPASSGLITDPSQVRMQDLPSALNRPILPGQDQ